MVGAELCNDIKIKEQLKKQRAIEKKELGDCCYQFGFQDPFESKEEVHIETIKGIRMIIRKQNTPSIEEGLKGYITKKMSLNISKENPNKMT
jgi:hypothetical protein